MNVDDKLYFSNIEISTNKQKDFWNDVRNQSSDGGKFYIDISKRIVPNTSVSRCSGQWSTPWNQSIIPGMEAPEYNPSFNKLYSDITDARALEIKELINQGQKFALFYSGGIDSTLVLFALIKNLTEEELKSLAICASVDSIIENPNTWEKYISGKFKIIDSKKNWLSDVILAGYRPITSEPADQIMGNLMAITMYHNYEGLIRHLSPSVKYNLQKIKNKISSEDTHYSAYKDLISRHLAYDTSVEGLKFGRILYEKYNKCIQTSPWPTHSLHDFFWSTYFNLKYTNCVIRGALYYNTGVPKKECLDAIIPWFHTTDYQQWSMVNNNNGQKIRNTLASYKYASRKYIHDFDKNDWFFYFKTKLESLTNILRYDVSDMGTNVGVDTNFQMLSFEDKSIKDYFIHHLLNYKIDWM